MKHLLLTIILVTTLNANATDVNTCKELPSVDNVACIKLCNDVTVEWFETKEIHNVCMDILK